MQSKLDKSYWQNRYQQAQTGWDLGVCSPPLKDYFDNLTNKDLKILIPGAGNAYEAEYLHRLGFTQVYVADFAQDAIQSLLNRVPDFPAHHALCMDFFEIDQKFDLIVEQTFFCAIDPGLRLKYAQKMHSILTDNGVLAGLLFASEFTNPGPPFGGTKDEYLALFSPLFSVEQFVTCTNSISPRMGNELFMQLRKT